MQLIQISFRKIMQSRAYTVIILGTDQKQFAIYTDPLVGNNLQLLLTNKKAKRPLTHELVGSIFKGLDIRLKQVVVNKIEDTIYFSRLFLEQEVGEETHILEIDARPSDCLTLALMHNAPIFCQKDVFESTVPVEGPVEG